MRSLFFIAFVLGALGGLAHCDAFKAVEPSAVQCVSTILADAAAGKSFSEILADAVPCGGDILTTVIETLLASKDPAVTGSQAYRDATRLHLAGADKK